MALHRVAPGPVLIVAQTATIDDPLRHASDLLADRWAQYVTVPARQVIVGSLDDTVKSAFSRRRVILHDDPGAQVPVEARLVGWTRTNAGPPGAIFASPVTEPPPALTARALVPTRTGPLPRGRIPLLADVENLVRSGRDRGLADCFAAMRAVFSQVAGCTLDLYAIHSEMPEDAPVAAWLKDRWHRSADTCLAFGARSPLSPRRYEGLILGMGDGARHQE